MHYDPLLSPQDIQEQLETVGGWEVRAGCIVKDFRFPTFKDSMTFVNRVAELAEAADHHPEITINYRRVSLSLVTHSIKGLTRKDFDLAREVGMMPESS